MLARRRGVDLRRDVGGARAPQPVLFLVGLALLGARSAFAAAPPPDAIPSRLGYVAPAGDRGCPTEEGFRRLVVEHLRRADPFTGDAGAQRIDVEVRREGTGYQVVVRQYDGGGKQLDAFDPWRRATCRQAADDAAQAIVEWLLVGWAPPKATECPAAAPAPVCAPVPECAKQVPLPPPPSARSERAPDPEPPSAWVPPGPLPRLGVRLGANVLAEQYATGQFSLGFALDLGLRYRWFSASVETHGDPPLGPAPIPGVGGSYGRIIGGALLCLHHDIFMLCGIGEAGRILFSVAPVPLPAAFYGAAGVRVGVEVPAGDPRLLIRFAGDLLAPFDRASRTAMGQNVYQTAAADAGLVIGLVYAP